MTNRRSEAVIALCGAGVFAWLVARFWPYTMDDAFITFRYAHNLASGAGLVFNPGEHPRAEGITSPLYGVVLSLGARFDLPDFAKVLGVGATVGTAVVLGLVVDRLGRDLGGSRPSVFGALAGAYWLTDSFVVSNAVSGMETGFASLAFASFLFFALGRGGAIALGLAALLTALFRPEMALPVVLLLVLGRHWRALGLFALLGAAYFGWRASYYGLPFPLPFYLKQNGAGLPGGRRAFPGLEAVEGYLRQSMALLALAAAAVVLRAKKLAAPAIAIVVQIAYYATIWHVMGFGFRFFQPISVAVVALAFTGGALLAARSRALALALVLPFAVSAFSAAETYAWIVGWYGHLEQNNVRAGLALREAAGGRKLRIALNDCGAIPFYTDFATLDLAGLNDRALALEHTPARARQALQAFRPHLVGLLASSPQRAFGWENLSRGDLQALGYRQLGVIELDPSYLLLLFGSDGPETEGLAERLTASGVLR